MTLDRPDHAPLVDFATITALATHELVALAQQADLQLPPGLEHGDLVFALLAHRLGSEGTGHVEGVFEVLPDGFGFLRSAAVSYAARPHDVYVSVHQARKLNLKAGHRIAGPVRGPRGNERFFALQHIERINDGTPEELELRIPFAARSPILPRERLRLAPAKAPDELLAVDHLAPWGKGQRVLVIAPPGHAQAPFLLDVAAALRQNHDELVVLVCLLDQRPEDAAAAIRRGHGIGVEVTATTFDEPASRHVTLTDLVLARAIRDVEAGRDVVLLFDSLSAHARACNVDQAPSGRLLCAGLDATATQRGKRLFSAARACEEGGSLTVVATAVAGEERIDQAILAEFAHRGNSEVAFTHDAGGTGVALDVLHTKTRNEDLLLDKPAADVLRRLRADLAALPPEARLPALLARLRTG